METNKKSWVTKNENSLNHTMRKTIDFLTSILIKVFAKFNPSKLVNILNQIKTLAFNKNLKDLADYINKVVKELDENQILSLCRFFAYQEILTNLAEDIFQISYENKWEYEYLTKDDYLTKFFNELKIKKGVIDKLNDFNIEIVLTAHPTQVLRETTLKITRKIMECLDLKTDYYSLTNIHLLSLTNNIEALITILWQSTIIREQKINVEDEVKNTLNYFDTTFFSILPKINLKFNQLTKKDFKISINDNLPFSIASWIGGDRDGNPFVNSDSLKNAFKKQTEKLFEFYFFKLFEIKSELAISSDFISDINLINTFNSDYKDLTKDKMPFQIAVSKIINKLVNTAENLNININYNFPNYYGVYNLGYSNYNQFLNDLNIILTTLKNNHTYLIANRNLVDLIYAVKCFQFHLMSIDIRQSSFVHTNVLSEILNLSKVCNDFSNLNQNKQAKILLDILNRKIIIDTDKLNISELTNKELDIFKTIIRLQNWYGNKAIKNYLISNASSFNDILSVYAIFKIVNPNQILTLNIVPLFESIYDLENAPNIVTTWISNSYTKKIIKEYCNNQIEILLGYSDSCKDGGNLMSSWSIYKLQKKLISLCKKHNVIISFFHGRGGTVARGGGSSYYAINAQPNNSIIKKMRFTEQGEVIWAKYANPRKAWYNFETVLAATANKIVDEKNNLNENKTFENNMDIIALSSFKKYQNLIYKNNDFESIFFDITPIKYISQLNIGSRPSSRKQNNQIKSLRAIPWVFAWSQIRAMVPGWYGVGSAITDFINQNPNNLKLLISYYQNIPFFNSFISNIEMLLSKVNMQITKFYFEINKSKNEIEVFKKIESEFYKTLDVVLKISQKSELLQDYDELKVSLNNRLPYLNVLNYFQIALIKNENKTKNNTILKKAILITINGIANGLRNSG